MAEQCLKINLEDVGNTPDIDEDYIEDVHQFSSMRVAFETWVANLKDGFSEIIDLESLKEIVKPKSKASSISLSEVRSAWNRAETKFISSQKSPQKGWSEDETHILIWVVIKYAEHLSKDLDRIEDEDFEKIAQMMPCKDAVSAKHKWLSMKQINLQQIPWTKEEDDLLTQIYSTFKKQDKSNKWSDISKVLESKTHIFRRGKQCRERWNNYLDPDMNRGNWSDLEDYKLLSIALELNSTQWSSIAKRLSKRTENAVKNRFKSLMKKERKERIKCGIEVKSADALTEHIDREVLTHILEKLQHTISIKSPADFSDEHQLQLLNPISNNTTSAQQQMLSMVLKHQFNPYAAAAAALNSSESMSPDNSPQRRFATQILLQQQKKASEEELAASHLKLQNGNLSSFSQAQFTVPDLQAQLLQAQQNQALQQQFSGLNLNTMSPNNAHSIFQQQLLQQQQQAQQQQFAMQQEGIPTNNTNTSLLQSLQSQAMQNHTVLVHSPQFINSVLTAAHPAIASPSLITQPSSNLSMNGPSSFSEAVNIYSGSNVPILNVNAFGSQNQIGSPLRQQNNAANSPGVSSTPYIQFANSATMYTPPQAQNGFSPTSIHARGQNAYPPSSFSCGNTPQSNRNKRSEKPSQFSDFQKLQKLRFTETEIGEKDPQQCVSTPSSHQESFKSASKKAEKQRAQLKFEEVVNENQQQNSQQDSSSSNGSHSGIVPKPITLLKATLSNPNSPIHQQHSQHLQDNEPSFKPIHSLLKPQKLSPDNHRGQKADSPAQRQVNQNSFMLPTSATNIGVLQSEHPTSFSISLQQLDYLQAPQQPQQQQTQLNASLQTIYPQQSSIPSAINLNLNYQNQAQLTLLQQQQQQQQLFQLQQQQKAAEFSQQQQQLLSNNAMQLNPQLLNLYSLTNQQQQQQLQHSQFQLQPIDLLSLQMKQQQQLQQAAQQQLQQQQQMQLVAQQHQQQQQQQQQLNQAAQQQQQQMLMNQLNFINPQLVLQQQQIQQANLQNMLNQHQLGQNMNAIENGTHQ